MKTNYPTKKLGEVCDVFTDGNWIESKDQSTQGIRLIQTGNIGRGVFLDKAGRARYISEETFKILNCTEIVPGDLLISRLPDPVGRSCVVPDIKSKMVTAVDCTIVRVKENMILRDFLLFYTNSSEYFSQVQGHLSGTTRKRISRGTLSQIEIPLPPLAEQKKIVAKLEKLLAKVNEAKKLRAEAQHAASQLVSAELHKIFTEGKKKHKPENLGNVASLVRGPFGGSLRKDMFVNEGYAVYEQGNVIKNDTSSFRYYISNKKFDEMRRFEVGPGDILMSCSGTIGKFTVIPTKFKRGIINQALLKITPGKNTDVDYLRYALDDYLKQSTTHIKGGAIKNIASVKELKKFEIPFPSLVEQKKIVAHLDSISEKAKQLQEYQRNINDDLIALEQSILSKAFDGSFVEEKTTIQQPIPSPFYRNQVNAAIVERVATDGGATTEVAVAKYNHLLQEMCGVPLGYEFAEHKFGPFDAKIKNLIWSGLGKNKWFAKNRGNVVEGQNVGALLAKKTNLYWNAKAGMKRLADLGITKLDVDKVELLSTVYHAIKQVNSTDLQPIRYFMSNWQTNGDQTKADKFTEEQTQKCLDFIVRNELYKTQN